MIKLALFCAGRETGRINNKDLTIIEPETVFESIAKQYPQVLSQLEVVAVVTGCFSSFNELTEHLSKVRTAARKRSNARIFRVLEHSIKGKQQLELIIDTLGYNLFVTMEAYDQNIRRRCLGRWKGRDVQEIIELTKLYAEYLEDHPDSENNLVRVTYLMGLDPLEKTEEFFQKLSDFNKTLETAYVAPWVSIFCPYGNEQRELQCPDYSLGFLLKAQNLCKQYFDPKLMVENSGGTIQGHARGLF